MHCRPHSEHTANVVLDISASDDWPRRQSVDFAGLLSMKGIRNA